MKANLMGVGIMIMLIGSTTADSANMVIPVAIMLTGAAIAFIGGKRAKVF